MEIFILKLAGAFIIIACFSGIISGVFEDSIMFKIIWKWSLVLGAFFGCLWGLILIITF